MRRSLGVVVVISALISGCFRPPSEDQPDGGPGGGSPAGDAGGGAGGGGGAQQGFTLEISPAALTVPVGANAPIIVSRIADDGTATDVTSQAELSVSPSGIATLSGGVLHGAAAGTATLLAKFSGQEAQATVSVPAAMVASLQVSPDQSTVAKGAVLYLNATALLTDDSAVDVTTSAQWSVDSSSVLQLVSPGVFRALTAGSARVTASIGSASATSLVTVKAAHVTAVSVSPASGSVAVGGALSLSAKATWDDGSNGDVTGVATWSASAPSFTVDAKGLATAKSAGAATISATFDGVAGQAMLVASAATLSAVTLTPTSLSLAPGGNASLRMNAQYSDGSTVNVTNQAVFGSSQPTLAAVSNTGATHGNVTALHSGAADITARFGGMSASAHVTISAATLTALSIDPPSVMINGAGPSFLHARATYSDGSIIDVTEQASWSSDDSTIAGASNVTGSRGKITGVNGGATSVHAVLNGLRANCAVTVQAATLTSIEVAPQTVTVEAGKIIALRAMAWFSDNTNRDVTEQATWSSMQPSIATVSMQTGAHGKVRALTNGSATIHVSFQSKSADGTVTVNPPTLASLSVSPGHITTPLGVYNYLEATAAYTDGSTQPATETATWTSSNPAVADIQITQGYAYLNTKTAGSTTITVTLSGVAPVTCSVTVTGATLTRVEVSPAQPSLPVGGYVELNATGVYNDFTTAYLRYSVSWTSSDPTVAVVGNTYQDKGVVTALHAGTTTITANLNGVIGTTTLTVTGATLQQIQVTPFAPHLPIGFDTYLRATGIYSDNSTRDLSSLVSWTSGASAIASVGSYGYLQPLSAGSATITATYGGVQGTTALTVTAATLTSVTVSGPAMTPLAVQATRQLSALGSFSDGSSMDVTLYVTWLSSAPSIANVSNAWPTQGEAKGLSAGNAVITAVRGNVTAAYPLQVQ